MKSFNTLTAIAIAASLVVGVTGCRKTPKNVTNIPRTNLTPIGEDAGSNIKLGGPTVPKTDISRTLPDDSGTKGTGIAPINPADFDKPLVRQDPSNFDENKTMFAADTVYFEFDRANVKSSELPKVQRVATYLKNTPSAMIRVEGNCDERGTEEYNRSLGERRALAVRELLIASGVAPDRVTTVTYGEDQPADPGHDQTAWDKNRRGDFVLLTPKTTQ